MTRAPVVALVLLLFVACNSAERVEVERRATRTVSPPPGPRHDITVEDAGLSILGNKLTVAAVVRNESNKHVGGIDMRVVLLDDRRNKLASFGETIPFCPARTSCWWGSVFGGAEFGPGWRETRDVRVRVLETEGVLTGKARILEFEVGRDEQGVVRGRVPADEGMAVIVGLSGGEPRSGIAVNVKKGAGFSTRLSIPPGILPPLSDGEQLRAFMYPMSIPQG